VTRLLCENSSGETIPAGGCIRVSAVGGASSRSEIRYTAIKPDAEAKFYFFNGPVTVISGQTLHVEQTGKIVRALVDWTDPDVAFGATVGPSSGSWSIDSSGTGFSVIGNAAGADGLTPVLRDGAVETPGGSTDIMAFEIVSVNCAEGYVTTDLEHIERYTGGCDSPPGLEEDYELGEHYKIYDYWLIAGPALPEDLPGTRARAVYWADFQDGYCTFVWDLDILEYDGGC
jgi:hypothetical protein